MFQDKLNANLKGLPGLLANPHQAFLLTHTSWCLLPVMDTRLFLLNGPSGPSRDSMVDVQNGQGRRLLLYEDSVALLGPSTSPQAVPRMYVLFIRWIMVLSSIS